MTSTRNADLFDPDRIPQQKLPDRPLAAETYPNGMSEVTVLALGDAVVLATAQNMKTRWVGRAHPPAP